jgi:hypothetical protein
MTLTKITACKLSTDYLVPGLRIVIDVSGSAAQSWPAVIDSLRVLFNGFMELAKQ